MFTLTYLVPVPGAQPELVTVCTPSRPAAFLTWWALRSGRFAVKPRLWFQGACIAG